jgi:hypothetical protein
MIEKLLEIKDFILDLLTFGRWSRWQGEKRVYWRVIK